MGGKDQETEQADDVATLYSWANLHGAKYRDFSAARQQARAQMRQRELADRARTAREEAAREAAPVEDNPLWDDILPTRAATGRGESPAGARPEAEDELGPLPVRGAEGHGKATGEPAATTLPRNALPIREEGAGSGRAAEADLTRPAWLAESPAAALPAKDTETLQQSRERVASRWFALQGIMGRSPEEAQPERVEGRAPVLTVFSLAGGVGKTSLVAGVARALAARGERVLLADTCSFGVLPFYFGAREIKPGVLRTFSGGASDPPIRVLTLEAERGASDNDLLRREMARGWQDASRVLIDVATGSAAMLRQALRFSPIVLVPVVPDMASVVTLQSLEAFFRNQEGASGHPLQAWYVLNQFDAALPLHLDVREVLRQQLGERLLPFAMRRNTAISEALAEGMTVIDYAPNSPAAEDIMNLVGWIRSASVAAVEAHRGQRWSER